MKLKRYLNERMSPKSIGGRYSYKTKKDKTGHIHDVRVDADGNGKTISTKGGGDPDHMHKIFEWSVQPTNKHMHTIDN